MTINLAIHDGQVILSNLSFHRYHQNDRLAIECQTDDGERYGVLTVNVGQVPLPNGQILIKDWSENTEMAAAFIKAGLIIPTGEVHNLGFVSAKFCRLSPELQAAVEKELAE